MELSYFLDQYYQATRVPLSFFCGKELVEKSALSLQDFNLPLILMNSLPDKLPPVWYSFTPEYLYFGGITVPEENGILFLGPLLPFECLPRQAELILHRLGRKTSDAPALRTYFSKNMPCDLPTLFSHLKLLNYTLNKKTEPDIVGMPFSWNIPYPVLEELPIELKIQVEPVDPWSENTLISYLRYGRLDAMEKLLNEHFIHTESWDEISLDYMRIYILSANIMASRTSVQVGMDYSLANALASYYLDKILHAKTKSELTYLFYDFFKEYTKRVERIHQLPSRSAAVRQIHQYIQSHLYEKITPALIAESLHMNCSYLCTHFRRETGKTISLYTQECKVKEAERLMEYKELSIVTIAEMLGFSSQSYFGSVFKRVTGKTPKDYREDPLNGAL